MTSDLRPVLRALRRSPASAGAAVLTLALTLGVGASVFAVVDAVLLTPPPFADPGALVTLGEAPAGDPGAAPRPVAPSTFQAWRERATDVASLEAWDATNVTLTGVGGAERVSATDVTPGFLSLLGVSPALGRGFGPDDAGRPVAVVSDAFWRTRLGADPAALGRTLVLGGRGYTVVGVLPAGFAFALNRGDVWRPLPPDLGGQVRVVARLRIGASRETLASALDEIPEASGPEMRAVATPMALAVSGDARRPLRLLAGAALLAVLLAFVNLAGLLVVRAMDRRQELAVRRALGARRWEVARRLLTEAVVLALLGALGGAVLASLLTPAAGHLVAARFGGVAAGGVALGWAPILLMTLAAVALACASGLLPAAGSARWSVTEVLRRGVTASPGELTARRVFVAAEVGLAFVLLVAMALVGGTLLRVLAVDPGFDARGVTALQLSLPDAAYPTDGSVAAFYGALQGALDDRLGPGAAAVVDELPLTGDRGRTPVAAQPGDAAGAAGTEAVVRTASPGYFRAMGIPLRAGQTFDDGDAADAPPRVVLSAALAQALFGAGPAQGRRVWLPARQAWADVVGVVGDVKHRTLEEAPLPTLYLSSLQAPSPSSVVVVRSGRPSGDVAAAVRDAVRALDAALPVYRVRPMEAVVDASPGVPARRLLAAAFALFAALAVALSAIGLFGVAAHDVARRRPELALRAVLGAEPGRILGATLGGGALTVVAGLAVGALLSFWAVRALDGLVQWTGGEAALTAAGAAALLLLVGATAVLPAALRAARTDPAAVLRGE